ncbi:hypothetical protein F5Y06DRAFT_70216 [Hypoxylon sp. FL0890]|nr:hypothetical protein F5Y06DRAFT_70216 [Hypoxylon sp. FL0890]
MFSLNELDTQCSQRSSANALLFLATTAAATHASPTFTRLVLDTVILCTKCEKFHKQPSQHYRLAMVENPIDHMMPKLLGFIARPVPKMGILLVINRFPKASRLCYHIRA